MDDLRQILLAKRSKTSLERAVSTGCTLLNLACSDNPKAGYLPGGYYYLVGDSASGKTWMTLGCLAEASVNTNFDKYRLIYDDVEGGALMDLEKFFGKKLARRIEPPARSPKGRPRNSERIEDFYYNIWDAIEQKKPFIYVLDSQDALDSRAAKKKFLEQRKAEQNAAKVVGSMGDGKAKYHSEHLRQVVGALRRTGSILLIVGQLKDNVSGWGDPRTRSGGRSLRYYANVEIWTSVKDKIREQVLGKKRTLGVEVLAEVRKNRITGKIGKDRAAVFPIYYYMGVDDMGACVRFLIEEGHWRKSGKGQWDAKEVFAKGTESEIIKAVESDGLENKVRELTAKVWHDIEAACVPQRKKRYE